MSIGSVLLTDFYKQCHAEQYDPKITKLVSYYTPRMSRLKGVNQVPVVGIQAFILEYLIDHFNKYFFNRDIEDVVNEYEYIITQTMGVDRLNSERIKQLHKLQYLPIEIRALEEGLLCPIKCPMIEISNTHNDFAWCTNLIESLMSSELWYEGCTATSGIMYRDIVNKYYEYTSDNLHLRKSAIAEFGFRGLPGLQAAQKASIGFLLSFNKTATIPSICYINKMYGDTLENIGTGMASTEHSVMCSSYSIDQDEETLIYRLLTQIYPSGNFSMVCDSYDYWNIVNNILPKFRKEIISRNGTLFIRGDSGDPIQVITDTVFALWDIFGGTLNTKGFKVLDRHVRAIYGDSITPLRAQKIYDRLMIQGFSAENVSLGAGSFSMLCLEEESEDLMMYEDEKECVIYENFVKLQPYTRDTFGVAIKSTYGEYTDILKITQFEENVASILHETSSFTIEKNPKTDTKHFKKSQKGACSVHRNSEGVFTYEDNLTLDEAHDDSCNLLLPVFRNGKILRTTTFIEIRNRLWKYDF